MRFRFALPLAAAILLSTAACSEWTARPLPGPSPNPTRIAGRTVRVTTTGGEVLNLSSAEVRGDSLYGMRVYSAGDPYVTLPLSEVARLETEQTNVTGPALFGLVALVAFWRYVALPALVGGAT
jgi:hypothetical protein